MYDIEQIYNIILSMYILYNIIVSMYYTRYNDIRVYQSIYFVCIELLKFNK